MDRRIGRVEAGSLALVIGQLASLEAGGVAAVAALTMAALSLITPHPRARDSWLRGGVILLLSFAVGSGLGWWGHRPPSAPDHVSALGLPWRGAVDAVVVDGPWRMGSRHRLTVEVIATRRGRTWHPRRGRLAVTAYGTVQHLEPGTRFRGRMSIRSPLGFRNPGSFDWVGFLARRGVHARASLAAGTVVAVVTPGTGRWRGLVGRWRRRVAGRLESQLSGDARGVLLALVVGHRGEVSPELRTRFVRAGVAHVLAISGLHIGIVAWIAARIVALVLIRSQTLGSRFASRAVARLAACVPAALYCALGGLGPSVLRAGAALGILALAGFADRRPDGLRVVALVAAGLALLEPGLARDIGFQLSLAAVVGLILGSGRRGGLLRRGLGASFGAWAATAPLLAHHFQEVSIVAPVVGPLLLPFFGVGPVTAGVIGALIEPVSVVVADTCFQIGAGLLRPGLWLVDLVARVPGAAAGVPRPSALEVVGIYVLLATLLTARLRRRRALLALVVLVTIADVGWWAHYRAHPGRLTVTFLDVGQGDASVVELPDGSVVVIDGGGLPGGTLDVGRAVVAPYLRTRKISRVDVVVVTHLHPDHFAGLVTVVETFRPREVWWPGVGRDDPTWKRLEIAAARVGARVRVVAAGKTVRLGGATIRIVHPPKTTQASLNDASVVLDVTWSGRRLLFTGDIESAAERTLFTAGMLAPVTVLKVPHHGSRTSSTRRFTEATAPALAVISVGAANRYGHPDPDVEARWRAVGSCVLRTDVCGAVRVAIGPGGEVVGTTVDASCQCPHEAN